MTQHTGAPTIPFDATLDKIGKWTIVRFPEEASAKLPSRGQVAVRGTINGQASGASVTSGRPRDLQGAASLPDREISRPAG